ncbi:hypothetical protein GTV32_15030 [Gordonia sp. SID5947]|uniref:hypothetical protein n=1 Tax=Gordonia sp. SID5947 TaxID=2690315 RepID=UPI00136CDEA5|nr:hypothetical protein [Gordonia sp. SID5947]MYR07533.1 hypothetical protein [Gordonia sp. SID5947]
MAHTSKRSRHRCPATTDRRSPLLLSVTSAALVASIATGVGAGLAQAAEQGGTSPTDTAPQQGGTSPTEPAPEQGGTTPTPEVAPVVEPGPGSIPAPPQEAPYQSYVEPSTYTAPTYESTYNPVPAQPLTAPKPTAPVRPIAPPPEKIRVGNFITDIPKGMSTRDVNSINAWSAYGEAKIAQNLIAVGVPEDQASRQAASTIIGVMAGGTAGAVALGIPAAALGAAGGAIVGVPVGAVAGAVYNSVVFAPAIAATGGLASPLVGLGALGGAGIGLAAGGAIGAAGVGAAGAAAGAVIGGTIGGALAYSLGAGDPGANPKEPWKQNAPKPKPLPNPQANQFEFKLPAEKAAKSGLPAVDYTVNVRGDVDLQVGGFTTGWSAAQADAPYKALGAGGPQQKDNARTFTKQNAPQAKQVLPGVQISWPQEVAPAR